MTRRGGIAARLLLAQLVVLLVAGATFALAMLVIAPGLFTHHLEQAGEESPAVQQHAQEAFEQTFAIALAVAGVVTLATAAVLLWLLSRRISRPIEELASAAGSIAAGDYQVSVPTTGYGRELTLLGAAFQQMADRLAATDRVQARMMADLAHELRTPLATLEAHIDGLEDGIVNPHPDTYAVMRAQIDRLRRLTGDIKLAAAAQEHALGLVLRPEPVDALLASACEAAATRYAAKGVDLRCAAPAHTVHVLADADRIGQVLGNLLDNALRHTPPGGTVDLAGSHTDEAVAITVTDTGAGIPADQLEAVFDRFHRGDPARASSDGGSGLGLTIARAIAIDHGGTLTATSPGPGGGTQMTLRLPAPSVE